MGKGKKYYRNPAKRQELTYEDARDVEVKKTWIYQVNKTGYPEELLALIDAQHIKALSVED